MSAYLISYLCKIQKLKSNDTFTEVLETLEFSVRNYIHNTLFVSVSTAWLML